MNTEEHFNAFYRSLFSHRWDTLYPALLAPFKHQEIRDGLLRPFFLDRASVIAASQLDCFGASQVLDLCAAPGGKTLVLGLQSSPSTQITANEYSAARRSRLKTVLKEHLPVNVLQRIQITGHDGTKTGIYKKEFYDRVLADVPCSSERHLLHQKKLLKQWSPARTRRLAIQAFAFLASALDALQPGGILVYSTCALSSLENDGVVDKLYKKRQGQFAIESYADLSYEKTDYGVFILPDVCDGIGPMYFSKIQKL